MTTRQQRRQMERDKQKKIAKVMNRTYTGHELQEAIERTMSQAFTMMQSLNSTALEAACANTKGIGQERKEALQLEFAKEFNTAVSQKLKEVEEKTFA